MYNKLQTIFRAIAMWFQSQSRGRKRIMIAIILFLCIYWLIVTSDVSEWWHWSEWQEHIQKEHSLK